MFDCQRTVRRRLEDGTARTTDKRHLDLCLQHPVSLRVSRFFPSSISILKPVQRLPKHVKTSAPDDLFRI